MKDFFNYIYLEGKAYSELIKRREDLKQKYKSESMKITTKKEKLFNIGDIAKMEINYHDKTIDKQRILRDKIYAFEHICYADTKELENLDNQLRYANKMNMGELKKLIKEYSVRFVDNIASLAQELNQSINDTQTIWTNLDNFVKSFDSDIKK